MPSMRDHFDESAIGSFPAGSFAYLDPSVHHYAMAATDGVVQIHGTAPVQIQLRQPERRPEQKVAV